MDYGRKGIRKKRELISSRRLATRHWIKTLILLILLVVLIAGIGYAGIRVYGYVKDTMANAPEIDLADVTPSGYMSTVYDAAGNVSAQLVGTGSNRVYATLEEIQKISSMRLWRLRTSVFISIMVLISRELSVRGCRGSRQVHFLREPARSHSSF